MSSTYTWSTLISYVSQSHPRLTADANGALLCDLVQSFVWGRADWRVSLVKLSPFYLIPLMQDYANPYINMPSDFLGLRAGTLTYNANEPPSTYPPLMVDRYLSLTNGQSRPTSISYEPTITVAGVTVGGIRIYPRPPSGIGPMDYQIECTYKKNPPKITTDTLLTPIPWDDQYFNVMAEGMRYFIKPVSQQDDRDLSRLISMADIMASHENVNLGEQNVHPREALVDWWGW